MSELVQVTETMEVAEAQEPKKVRLFYSEKKGCDIEVNTEQGETGFTTFGFQSSDLPFAIHDRFDIEDGSIQEIVLHDILTRYPKNLIIQILMECHRVLAPFGQIEIMVANLKHPWLEGDLGHLTYISPKTFETLSAFNPLKLDDPRTPIGSMTGMNLFMGQFKQEGLLEEEYTQYWFKLVKVV